MSITYVCKHTWVGFDVPNWYDKMRTFRKEICLPCSIVSTPLIVPFYCLNGWNRCLTRCLSDWTPVILVRFEMNLELFELKFWLFETEFYNKLYTLRQKSLHFTSISRKFSTLINQHGIFVISKMYICLNHYLWALNSWIKVI